MKLTNFKGHPQWSQRRKRRAPRKGTVSGPQRRKAALRRVDQDPTFRIASALRSQSGARQASGWE